jgi:hypothetical protein
VHRRVYIPLATPLTEVSTVAQTAALNMASSQRFEHQSRRLYSVAVITSDSEEVYLLGIPVTPVRFRVRPLFGLLEFLSWSLEGFEMFTFCPTEPHGVRRASPRAANVDIWIQVTRLM